MDKWVLIIISYCVVACNNNSRQKSGAENHDFFPAVSLLESQVHEVDSLKPLVYKYTVAGTKTDSVLLSIEEFNSLAKEFMEPDINDPSIKKYYKESSFADQSIPNVTFTYSTTNAELPLQRMDIIINPDPVLNDQLQSIYMEKITRSGDTSVVKKLYWKTKKYFQIISSRQSGGHPAIFSQVKVVWDAD